jgi:hypothetical protein
MDSFLASVGVTVAAASVTAQVGLEISSALASTDKLRAFLALRAFFSEDKNLVRLKLIW